jgi:uncharacterized protein (DUF1499 family)
LLRQEIIRLVDEIEYYLEQKENHYRIWLFSHPCIDYQGRSSTLSFENNYDAAIRDLMKEAEDWASKDK